MILLMAQKLRPQKEFSIIQLERNNIFEVSSRTFDFLYTSNKIKFDPGVYTTRNSHFVTGELFKYTKKKTN